MGILDNIFKKGAEKDPDEERSELEQAAQDAAESPEVKAQEELSELAKPEEDNVYELEEGEVSEEDIQKAAQEAADAIEKREGSGQ